MTSHRLRWITWPLALAFVACAADEDTTPVVDTGRGGYVTPTGGSEPPGNVWRGGSQTVCRRTVPESVAPSIDCAPTPIGGGYDGCSSANQPCGPLRGCILERSERIESDVDASYATPAEGFAPPHTRLPAMGTEIHGRASAWFARGDGTAATGSCGLPPVRNIMAVAISARDFGSADWCGACAEVVGRSGQRVRVQIVDQCAGCEHGAIDLAAGRDSPFAMLEVPHPPRCSVNDGRQPVDWHVVPCETQGGIVVHYPPGFNHCTPAVQIRNHRLPIVRLEDRIGGEWAPIERQAHNWYYVRSPGDCRPFDITLRITAIDGSTITGTFPPYEAGASHEANAQF